MGVKQMVNRFLGWKLPKDFAPDGGISFKESALWPTGTNLFTATQAEEMFLHVLGADGELLNFGDALMLLKSGQKVARLGWNGKGMFLFLVPGSVFKVNRLPLLGIYPEGTEINYCPHIDMRTADGKIVPWLASQTDVLAEDWVIVE